MPNTRFVRDLISPCCGSSVVEKFNNGNGALICFRCSRMVKRRDPLTELLRFLAERQRRAKTWYNSRQRNVTLYRKIKSTSPTASEATTWLSSFHQAARSVAEIAATIEERRMIIDALHKIRGDR